MSSTNKTTHYELSQYLGTDKPTYLVDYNGDMSKIDTGIYNAKNEADTNATNIGTLANLTTDSKTNVVSAINEVDSHADTNASNIASNTSAIETNTTNIGTNTTNIGTLANLNTTNKTNLVSAINEIVNKFNLSTITTYTKDDMTASGCTINSGTITIAKNSDSSICKIYGVLILTKTQATATITIPNTGISVDSEITVSPCGEEAGGLVAQNTSAVFNTNGSITLRCFGAASGNVYAKWFPFLIFVKDFGDVE